MRIGIDVMGGDHAPGAILDGALSSLEQLDAEDHIVLVGDQAVIDAAIQAQSGLDTDRIEVVHASQVISMDESPVDAVRTKKDSSIAVLGSMGSRKAAKPLDALISAGNTGAMVTAAQMYMRRLPNVHRPGVAVPIPTFAGTVVLIDVGANIEPKPTHLTQYGLMGSVYAERILGVENPRVGLMNVGGEETKGTADIKAARDRLRQSDCVNFIGYVEGRGVFDGEADVVITDGVVGNVMLKLAEGLSAGIFRSLKRELRDIDPELAQRLDAVVKRIYARHDYHEYGGAPLLGANGACFIAHGSSEARTIRNAVIRAKEFVESGINQIMSERLGILEEVPV